MQVKFTANRKRCVAALATLCVRQFSVQIYSMITTPELYERLEARRAELRLSQAEVGRRAFNQGDGSALQNIKRGSSPSFENLQAICRVLKLEVSIASSPSREFSEDPAVSDLGKKEALRSGFLPIPWHPASRLAGSAPVAFSQAWLAANGLLPDFLQAIIPNFADKLLNVTKNSVALLQTNSPRKGAGAIWCYRDGLSICIARVGFVDGATVIFSNDEASHPLVIPKEATPGLELLGKVVWLGFTV